MLNIVHWHINEQYFSLFKIFPCISKILNIIYTIYILIVIMTQKNFKDAFIRLREIQQELEDEEIIDVDKLIALQKEAKELYDFCESKIKKLDEDLSK